MTTITAKANIVTIVHNNHMKSCPVSSAKLSNLCPLSKVCHRSVEEVILLELAKRSDKNK